MHAIPSITGSPMLGYDRAEVKSAGQKAGARRRSILSCMFEQCSSGKSTADTLKLTSQNDSPKAFKSKLSVFSDDSEERPPRPGPKKPIGYTRMEYESPGDDPEPYIICGPIIGKVTSESARIVVELNKSDVLTVRIASSDGKEEIIVEKMFTERLPAAIEIDGLSPSTEYVCWFSCPAVRILRCSFKTVSVDQSLEMNSANVGIVCGTTCTVRRQEIQTSDKRANFGFDRMETMDDTAWQNLYHRVHSGEVTHVIHMGGNFLSTAKAGKPTPWEHALNVLSWRDPHNPVNYEEVREVFRRAFREALSQPFIKHILANVSNIILPDDNEFRPWVKEGRAGSPLENITSKIAWEVFAEYATNLVEDYTPEGGLEDFEKRVNTSLQCFSLGEVGVLYVDPTERCLDTNPKALVPKFPLAPLIPLTPTRDARVTRKASEIGDEAAESPGAPEDAGDGEEPAEEEEVEKAPAANEEDAREESPKPVEEEAAHLEGSSKSSSRRSNDQSEKVGKLVVK
eukprot:GHVU01021205.1.p1 GENE.GHVU01021205.1~~GHVU01021205.1.p1  ORF type:complete len:513 (-),score=72.23 GHVU01021205.1:1952-3490(-)